MIDFEGKPSLVTGGASGIGRSLALAMAAQGSPVVIADLNAERAQEVVSEVKAIGGSAVGIDCDVSDRRSVLELRDRALAAFGPTKILFANAGVTAFEAIADMSEADVNWLIGVNLFGVTHCLQAFLPGMIAAGEGHIVTTASMAGLMPHWMPYHVPYAGAKAAAIAMMINLRSEVEQYGIGSTVLCPGGVKTRIMETPTYRPERFGGPKSDVLTAPKSFSSTQNIHWKDPNIVAQMTLSAIRKNRAIVLTDGTRRDVFHEYVKEVDLAFDDALEFDGAIAAG